MFTGIVEQIGVVASVIKLQQMMKLAISAGKFYDDLKVGESVAVNGVCLTATTVRRGFAEFDAASETLKRSTIGDLRISSHVNLEKALPLSGRLGGHIMTGHVDGMAEVKNKILTGEGSFELYLSIPSELLRYLVPKGSIAVDGVSLTVADIRDGLLRVVVIPQTAKTTTLGLLNVSDRVNVEVDLLSKYIERHLLKEPATISEEMMLKVGFLPMGWIDN
ncbi:MAG: riboflavin synthase [bacterium]